MPPATFPSKTTVYQLVYQTVVGSLVSVDTANLVIEDVEPLLHSPHFWKQHLLCTSNKAYVYMYMTPLSSELN